jgi:hypothetical protein
MADPLNEFTGEYAVPQFSICWPGMEEIPARGLPMKPSTSFKSISAKAERGDCTWIDRTTHHRSLNKM